LSYRDKKSWYLSLVMIQAPPSEQDGALPNELDK